MSASVPRPGAETAQDATNAVSADGKASDGREALRRDLAAIIAHPKMPASERSYFEGGGCDRCPKALGAADAVLDAGFRRVVVDDTTAERVGYAVRDALTATSAQDFDSPKAAWSAVGRAAVRAVLGEDQP